MARAGGGGQSRVESFGWNHSAYPSLAALIGEENETVGIILPEEIEHFLTACLMPNVARF